MRPPLLPLWRTTVPLLLAVLLLAACASSQPVPGVSPSFAISTGKPEDTVTPVAAASRVRFDVRSPSGIGSARVSLTAGQWPRSVKIRFDLRSLEEMRFHYGDTTILVAVPYAARGQTRESVIGADGSEEPLTPDDPRWMPVDVRTSATSAVEYIEVTVPEAFSRGEFDGFEMSWIDFYR